MTLGPARLSVGQVRAGQASDEDLRLADDALIDEAQRHAGPIDFERLAGAMRPAHRRRPRASLPDMEMRAELGVAVAFRMSVQIFQPQQPQRHAAPAQLLLDRFPIRQRTTRMACVGGREQAMIEVLLAQLRRGLPVQASRRGAVEIFLHGRARDPNAARYRRIAQPQPPFEPKHLLDPPHRHPRSWHLPAPPKGATVAAITCRSAAMPKPIRGAENAEIECRIGAKSGAASAEITCRFQPKSGAGLLRFLQP